MARGSTRAWRKVRAFVLVRDQGICHLCGLAGATSVDHLVPVAHGGGDDPANLAAAHLRCNESRGDRALARPRASRRW